MGYVSKGMIWSPSLSRLARGSLGNGVKARRAHKMSRPFTLRSEALKLGLAAHLFRCAHDVWVCKGKPGRGNIEIIEGAA